MMLTLQWQRDRGRNTSCGSLRPLALICTCLDVPLPCTSTHGEHVRLALGTAKNGLWKKPTPWRVIGPPE